MSIEMMIYLIGLLDQVSALLGVMGCAALGFTIWAFVQYSGYEDTPEMLKQVKRGAAVAISCALLTTALPSGKTATLMVAASLGKDALASETGQKLKKVLDSKLDQLVAEVEKKGK